MIGVLRESSEASETLPHQNLYLPGLPTAMEEDDQASQVLPRDFLCCQLCHEELHQPKCLPCLHSFCRACLKDHIQHTIDLADCFPCPVCNTDIEAPDSDLSLFPDNVFIGRLSSPRTDAGRRDTSCGPCRTSGLTTSAKVHCINCDDFLCGRCALSHSDQGETSSHKTQKIQRFKEVEKNRLSTPPGSALSRCCLATDVLDTAIIFCTECEMALCSDCQAKFHKDHKCCKLNALSQNFENKIQGPLQELMNDHDVLKKALVSIEKVKQYTNKRHENVKEAIRSRTQVLCNIIAEYANMLSLEADKRHTENMVRLTTKEEALRRHAESINGVTNLTQMLLTFGRDDEKVVMRRHIGRRVREMCEMEPPANQVRLIKCHLCEPVVPAEAMFELFGTLTSLATIKKDASVKTNSPADFVDTNGRDGSQNSPEELIDLDEFEEHEKKEITNVSCDNERQKKKNSLKSYLNGTATGSSELCEKSDVKSAETPTSGFDDQSHSQSEPEVPCLNLKNAKWQMDFPDLVVHDCIKGVGVNSKGDIIVGTVSPQDGNKVFILEKHGIVRGQIPVDKHWHIHSIAADGKVSLVQPRSENKFKVKVMSGESTTQVLVEAHIESFGLNAITASRQGRLLTAANRYAVTKPTSGRSAKHGGNITVYNQEGAAIRVITNETFAHLHEYLFDRPHFLATDTQGNIFIGDPGRHSVVGISAEGEFLFEYGTTDAEEELYQGPDAICTDGIGHVIVFDKKDGRIDILNYQGQLLKCYFPSEHFRFLCATPDKTLMLVNSEGRVKFFDYL